MQVQFLFGDNVEIIDGFYKGCRGPVIDYIPVAQGFPIYVVTINKVINNCNTYKDIKVPAYNLTKE